MRQKSRGWLGLKGLVAALLMLTCGGPALAQGGRWQAQSSNLPLIPSGLRAMSVISPTVAWGLSYSAITPPVRDRQFTRTVDGGTNWVPGTLPAPTPDTEASDISAVNGTTAWVAMADIIGNGG